LCYSHSIDQRNHEDAMPKKLSWIIPADKGQGAGLEKNNCAVRAVANATGKEYSIVHATMQSNGRKHGKGTPWKTISTVHNIFGLSIIGVFGSTKTSKQLKRLFFNDVENKKGITIERFIKENQKGKFIVGIRGHNTTIIDGKLIDSYPINGASSVLVAWKYED